MPKHDVARDLDDLTERAAAARARLGALRQEVSALHAMLQGLRGELSAASVSAGDGTVSPGNKQEEKK